MSDDSQILGFDGQEVSAPKEALALLNHDIRAAISDVIGGLRLIDLKPLDQETKAQIDRVRSASESLARLTEDALLHVIGGDELSHALSPSFDFTRFFKDLSLRWQGRAQEMGATCAFALAPDVPGRIATDRIALDRILSNALANALKHDPRGCVALDVTVDAGGALVFYVTDQGPGFSEAALEQLFLPRGRPRGSKVAGSGLGLFIAQDLAAAIGGTVAVENRTQGGAILTLRLDPGTWEAERSSDARVSQIDLSGLRVLVADDSKTQRLLVSQMLDALKVDYAVVEDGAEALAWLERECFDLALLDMEMPHMTGLDVVRAVRNKPAPLGEMSLVVMTAFVFLETRSALYEAGVSGILTKPLARLEAFGHALQRYADQATTRCPKEVAEEAGAIDFDQFEALLNVTGAEGAAELTERLCEDFQRVTACITDPEATIETLRAETHVLISLAGAIGAGPLQSLAMIINRATYDDSVTAALVADLTDELAIVLPVIESRHRIALMAVS